MTPSQLPVDLRPQQIIASFYRAGYPIAEIADEIALKPSACQDLLAAMRDAGWTLRRPRGAHERIQVENAFLRERYLQCRAQARRRGERLSLSELARTPGSSSTGTSPTRPGSAAWLRLTLMPDGTLRTHIPLGLALALALEPREVEAHDRAGRLRRPGERRAARAGRRANHASRRRRHDRRTRRRAEHDCSAARDRHAGDARRTAECGGPAGRRRLARIAPADSRVRLVTDLGSGDMRDRSGRLLAYATPRAATSASASCAPALPTSTATAAGASRG